MGTLRVTLEVGPKGKRAVAVAPDWPGLERGAPTTEGALGALGAYRARYRPVAGRAGFAEEFAALGELEVVETYPGVGSTDFWGISFAFSSADRVPMAAETLERRLALLAAAWSHFDDVRARVSPAMRKGPRGGGRDRDRIVRHVLDVEVDWARKVGCAAPDGDDAADPEALAAHRAGFLAAIRAYQGEGRTARTWPLAYLIRHSAFHVLDHAWEMEDKDLGADAPAPSRAPA